MWHYLPNGYLYGQRQRSLQFRDASSGAEMQSLQDHGVVMPLAVAPGNVKEVTCSSRNMADFLVEKRPVDAKYTFGARIDDTL